MLSAGLIATILLFAFGNIVPPGTKEKKPVAKSDDHAHTSTDSASMAYTTGYVITQTENTLSSAQQSFIKNLEQKLTGTEGDAAVYQSIASFWIDSIHNHILGAYYIGKIGKLENSQKKLTFAARLMLDNLMAEENVPMQKWIGQQTKELFEKVLVLDPANDSAKVGLGAAYLFGNFSDNPMAGISLLREVTDKDPGNVYANLMLGMGGVKSGQFDKAIERFEKVLEKDPDNLQAVFHIAETYDRKGDKPNAIKWYKTAEEKIAIPEAKQEINERIKQLQLH